MQLVWVTSPASRKMVRRERCAALKDSYLSISRGTNPAPLVSTGFDVVLKSALAGSLKQDIASAVQTAAPCRKLIRTLWIPPCI